MKYVKRIEELIDRTLHQYCLEQARLGGASPFNMEWAKGTLFDINTLFELRRVWKYEIVLGLQIRWLKTTRPFKKAWAVLTKKRHIWKTK